MLMRPGSRESPSWPGAPETGYVSADRSSHPIFTLADGAGHTFFQQTQFQHLLSDHLLQGPRLTAKVRHLAACRRARRIARQPAFAGLQELLRPAVIKAFGNTFPPAQFGSAGPLAGHPARCGSSPRLNTACALRAGCSSPDVWTMNGLAWISLSSPSPQGDDEPEILSSSRR
jgi:hypothetical protein